MPDYDAPVIIRRGATIGDFCKSIHNSLIKEFKHALVWGTSVKFNPQTVGINHVMEDEDVV